MADSPVLASHDRLALTKPDSGAFESANDKWPASTARRACATELIPANSRHCAAKRLGPAIASFMSLVLGAAKVTAVVI